MYILNKVCKQQEGLSFIHLKLNVRYATRVYMTGNYLKGNGEFPREKWVSQLFVILTTQARVLPTLMMGWLYRHRGALETKGETLSVASLRMKLTRVEKPNWDRESWMSTAGSNQESATGDCLSCSDTEEAAVKSACKKF